MNLRVRPTSDAFLLQETMISLSIFSAISLALIMGFVSLERNFAATTDFATNHSDSVRISDYLALDLRRALSVTTAPNDVTLTVPAYYDAQGNPQTPQIDSGGDIYYGTSGSTVLIHYYLSNGTIYRKQDNGTAIAIAANVSDFSFTVSDLGKVATTKVTFNPIFMAGGASTNAIAATAVYNTTLLRNGSGVYN